MSCEKTPALYTAKFPFDEDDGKKRKICSKTLVVCILTALLIGLCIALTLEFLYPMTKRLHEEDIDEVHSFQGQEVNLASLDHDDDKSLWHLDFLINPTRLCETINPPESEAYQKDPEVKLLMLVPSATGHFAQRRAIRRTWGSVGSNGPMRLGFVLGVTSNDTETDLIERESVAFGDIIQADFEDTYRNLTTKSILMLKWVSKYCAHAQYFLKADDDTFVNLHAIAQILQKDPYQTKEPFIGGFIHRSAIPLRDPNEKYYVSEEDFPNDEFPPYASGSAYLSTGPTAARLFDACRMASSFIPMEDVFVTGLCGNNIDATLLHEPSFLYRDPPMPITWDSYSTFATAHSVTPDEIEQIWDEMTKSIFGALGLMDIDSGLNISEMDSSAPSSNIFLSPGRNSDSSSDSISMEDFLRWPELRFLFGSPLSPWQESSSSFSSDSSMFIPSGMFRFPETDVFNLTFFFRK